MRCFLGTYFQSCIEFIVKLLAIDTLTAFPCARGIARLQNEPFNVSGRERSEKGERKEEESNK